MNNSKTILICLIILFFGFGIFYIGQQSVKSGILYIECRAYSGEVFSVSYNPKGFSYVTFMDKSGMWLSGNIMDIIYPGKTYTFFYSELNLLGYREWK